MLDFSLKCVLISFFCPGADCGASDDNEVPDVFILTHRRPTNKISHALNNSFPGVSCLVLLRFYIGNWSV